MLKRHGESAYTPCPLCGQEAVGHLEYENGECQEGCADCLLEIAADPHKPVDRIVDWAEEERKDAACKERAAQRPPLPSSDLC